MCKGHPHTYRIGFCNTLETEVKLKSSRLRGFSTLAEIPLLAVASLVSVSFSCKMFWNTNGQPLSFSTSLNCKNLGISCFVWVCESTCAIMNLQPHTKQGPLHAPTLRANANNWSRASKQGLRTCEESRQFESPATTTRPFPLENSAIAASSRGKDELPGDVLADVEAPSGVREDFVSFV